MQRFFDIAKDVMDTRTGKIFSVLLIAFVSINVIIFVVFAGRTYPNAQINNNSIGFVSYSQIPKKLNKFDLQPKTIIFYGNSMNFSVSAAKLGIKIDNLTMVNEAHHRSWLPVANFFASHKLPARYQVDQKLMSKELDEISTNDRQAPTDAQIALQDNNFTILNSKKGYKLNSIQAAKLINSEVSRNHTKIKLPYSSTSPKVTEASLEPSLQQLRAQQGVSLTFNYNGNSTKVAAATIAGWYAEVNDKFQIQPVKVQDYINQFGATNGIHVKNLSDLVSQTTSAIQKASSGDFTLVAVPQTICSPNAINQFIIVSISQRHLWACNSYNLLYESAVVTGMQNLPADLTPTGTYKIASKQTNLFLNGSDSTGSWHQHVNYWMPFLTNQYGVYGFHDATWRSDSDFGNIDPNSSDASHGCVELPLTAAKWLYGWAAKGATVNINS
ncbi:MAG TPA: L,D-transpeptidase family protein [Candidatus Saccharimonadales bacterium]|nr:L,D-transpeptidase family protein [Candidatus Saccharimonadales bacterium]